jgi:erythronate-4-phosphate dehydrogenase
MLKIVVNKNTPLIIETLSHLGNIIALDTTEVTRDTVRDADILIVRSETKVDKNLLEGSSVRFVGTTTIGMDHVDIDYLSSRGIFFTNAPGSNSNSVAEYMAAALIQWSKQTGEPLKGKTIGVVGVGNVGSKVVRVAKAFDMEVILNDPPLARQTSDSKYRPLDESMGADFVSLHVPLTKTGQDATFHFFDEERIRKMKPGSVLINTSRGAVVESNALSKALESKHLSAAIIDVWENEPRINTNLLTQCTIGTPHIAGYSYDGKTNALRMVYEELCRFLGATPQWNAEAIAIPQEGADITIPSHLTNEFDIVAYAIEQAYDILLDDHIFRQISALPSDEQWRYFMKLRAEYKIRREFFNRVVKLSPQQSAASEALRKLGFCVQI